MVALRNIIAKIHPAIAELKTPLLSLPSPLPKLPPRNIVKTNPKISTKVAYKNFFITPHPSKPYVVHLWLL
jgi:hypothetical protein